MNPTQLDSLVAAIATAVPSIVIDWNTKKLPQFENLVEQSFREYFDGRQTQEKTKLVAPILDVVFARLMKTKLTNFEIDEGKGRDYCYGTTPLESKITLGQGNGWVGNGYTKTPWHILMKFDMDDDGHIGEMFATLVDLDQCKSKWTKPDDKSNFSGLTFLVEDASNLMPIIGTVKHNSKYLKPILVEKTPLKSTTYITLED